MGCANGGCAAVALEVEPRALGHGLLDTTSIYVSPEAERMGASWRVPCAAGARTQRLRMRNPFERGRPLDVMGSAKAFAERSR